MRLQLGQTQLELFCMKTGKKSSKHRANVGLRPITCEDCESEIFLWFLVIVSHCECLLRFSENRFVKDVIFRNCLVWWNIASNTSTKNCLHSKYNQEPLQCKRILAIQLSLIILYFKHFIKRSNLKVKQSFFMPLFKMFTANNTKIFQHAYLT